MSLSRRRFLQTSAITIGALGVHGAAARAARSADDSIGIAVIGVGGRGTQLAASFAQLDGVRITHVCDPDGGRAAAARQAVGDAAERSSAPSAVADFRDVLDDKNVDAVVIATCNHWHAPAAILACSAGKHVYVEKPCSHNPREGELMVEAAARHDRLVQMGNQRRSSQKIAEAIALVQKGEIGRPYLAQCWYTSNRPSIGRATAGEPPAGLNYDLWQGPAPRRPFHANYLHYNWHWFWHWGNGELGNNGIHFVDLCRWGLEVKYPTRVASSGARLRFDDDQETPDTQSALWEFSDRRAIEWLAQSCTTAPSKRPDILFHGEGGSLAIAGGGYTIYDPRGREIRKAEGNGGDAEHLANFVDAIRGQAKLASPIVEGHKSTLLCQLGNIAYRTGRTIECDAATGSIKGDLDAARLWSREYEKGWEPKV